MREEIARDMTRERLVAVTSGFFGLLALLLVAIGIFGVASSTVAQRTNELGIRLALGATRWSVIRESLRDTMVVFAVGLVVGVLAAVVGLQLIDDLCDVAPFRNVQHFAVHVERLDRPTFDAAQIVLVRELREDAVHRRRRTITPL